MMKVKINGKRTKNVSGLQLGNSNIVSNSCMLANASCSTILFLVNSC